MVKGLFVGLTVVDIQYFIDNFIQSNEKIKTHPPDILVGGPAANAAITFSFLGGSATFISVIGKNEFTTFIRNDFKKYQIEVIDYNETKENKAVIATVITTNHSGDRAIISNMPPTLDLVKNAQDLIEIDNFDFIFTDGFYPELAIPIAQLAKSKNIPVIFDGGSWKPYLHKLLPFVDYAICSENFKTPNAKNKVEIINQLIQIGIRKIAISQGNKPTLYYDLNTINKLDINPVDPVDTLGAGDILHGSFSYFLFIFNDFKTALSEASKVATFSCQFKGTRIWMDSFHFVSCETKDSK